MRFVIPIEIPVTSAGDVATALKEYVASRMASLVKNLDDSDVKEMYMKRYNALLVLAEDITEAHKIENR